MQVFVSWLVSNDRNLFSFINTQLRNNVLDYLMPRITHLGGATITVTSLLMLIAFFSGNARSWAIEAFISLSVSHIFVQIIKKIYGRKRPYMVLTNARTFANPLVDYSFPSGHTTSSFAIATAFALHSFVLGLILIPLALMVGISRMYLGLHYPTDCIFGAVLGTVTSIVAINWLPLFF